MYKASWGQKRICPCNKIRYYDLGREKLDCPECGKEIEVVNLAKPRRGRKPGSLNTQMSGTTVSNPVQDPKPIPEEDLNIESVEDVDIEQGFTGPVDMPSGAVGPRLSNLFPDTSSWEQAAGLCGRCIR